MFRFNALGKLAAYSEAPSKYDEASYVTSSGDEINLSFVSDDRTYKEDAKMLVAIWSIMLAMCICSCCSVGGMVA